MFRLGLGFGFCFCFFLREKDRLKCWFWWIDFNFGNEKFHLFFSVFFSLNFEKFNFFFIHFIYIYILFRPRKSESIGRCIHKWSSITESCTIKDCWISSSRCTSMCYIKTITCITWLCIKNIESLSGKMNYYQLRHQQSINQSINWSMNNEFIECFRF